MALTFFGYYFICAVAAVGLYVIIDYVLDKYGIY